MGMGEQRDRWSNKTAFVLAAIGCAVGLGNIWRYPYVAYNAGGGAFLIPYFLALFTAGIPLLMVEFGIGHKMQGSGPRALGRVHRSFEFTGWWAVLGSMLVSFYYAMIMGWVSVYMWELTKGLFTGAAAMPWGSNPGAYFESTVTTGSASVSVAENDFTAFNWPAFIFNAVVWACVYFSIRKGVQTVGKVVWFTVLAPYLLLFILFFTAINLPGASSGLAYYLDPDWSKFTDPETGNISVTNIAEIGSAAYEQIFFSLSVGFGVMIAYASFLPKKADVANSAVITAYANSATEFFGGFITFAVLGFMAMNMGRFPGEVVGTSGFGIAFVSYPTAISQITDSVVINSLIGLTFFGCLWVLGVDCAFTLVDSLVAGLVDKFNVSRQKLTAGLCILGLLVGSVFCFPAGLFYVDVTDHYFNRLLLLVGIGQCIAVGWVYGAKKMRHHINGISDHRISPFFDFCIKYFTPAVLVFLLVWGLRKDLAFLWDPGSKPFGGYSFATQMFGIGALTLMLGFTIWFTLKKPTRHNYLTAPEEGHD